MRVVKSAESLRDLCIETAREILDENNKTEQLDSVLDLAFSFLTMFKNKEYNERLYEKLLSLMNQQAESVEYEIEAQEVVDELGMKLVKQIDDLWCFFNKGKSK